MMRDLDALIGRLRSEANLNIMRVAADEPTVITVQAVPRATMQSAVPRAACFVVPRLTSWDEFKIDSRTPQVDWTTLTRCDRAAIFVPSDVPPKKTALPARGIGPKGGRTNRWGRVGAGL